MNPAWVQVILATAVAWLGALFAALLRHAGARIMRPLVYLALLFFALVAIFDILPESKQALSWPVFVAAVGLGYLAFWLIGKHVAPICPACAIRHFEHDHHHASGKGLVFFGLVLGIHCFLDGLGVSAASTVEAGLGLRVFGATAVHKLPEGVALGLMLTTGSRSAWRAFTVATAIETATLAGAVVGVFWLHPSEFWLGLVLAHVGGTFLYLSVSGIQDALSLRTAPVVVTQS